MEQASSAETSQRRPARSGLGSRIPPHVPAAPRRKSRLALDAVADLLAEADVMKLGDSTGLGPKKARQIKFAAEQYLSEEQKLREELIAERERQAAERALEAATPQPTTAEAE